MEFLELGSMLCNCAVATHSIQYFRKTRLKNRVSPVCIATDPVHHLLVPDDAKILLYNVGSLNRSPLTSQ